MSYFLKFASSSRLKVNIQTVTKVHITSCISPLNRRQFQRYLYYYNYNTLKPLKLSSNTNSVNNYSSDKKSENVNVTSNKGDSHQQAAVQVNQRTKLKQAVRDYGATIIVFHVAISLASLGISYLAISNGVDAVKLLTFIGFSESVISSKIAVGGSTFVIAYAVHKLFAPVRIGITLSVAPFIVRYLRKIKWLKSPAVKKT